MAMFLYRYMKEPQLMQSLLANPLGLTFVSETALLLLLFLIAVWYVKRERLKVFYYLLAAFVGGLAFALPPFSVVQQRRQKEGFHKCHTLMAQPSGH
jgi:ABC-type Fe3+-siderophore transport system permease subunit